MTQILNGGTGKWLGLNKMEFLFVFGDSYSSIFQGNERPDPKSDPPFGVPFPGYTYAEAGKANWVGYLYEKYAGEVLLVYDYAVGGSTVRMVASQAQRYLRGPGDDFSSDAEGWSGSNSLFVTWVGNNDVAYPDPPGGMEKLLKSVFDIQDTLYRSGARNFLLLTVPSLPAPQHGDSPGEMIQRRKRRRQAWNEALSKPATDHDGPEVVSAPQFAARHPDAVVMVYDACDLFEKMFSNPAEYGLAAGAGRAYDGVGYVDHIHPTTRVHEILATELAKFLSL